MLINLYLSKFMNRLHQAYTRIHADYNKLPCMAKNSKIYWWCVLLEGATLGQLPGYLSTMALSDRWSSYLSAATSQSLAPPPQATGDPMNRLR